MYTIGVHMFLDPYVGGSYQYWYSILKALSSLDSCDYFIIGIYSDDEWKSVFDSFGIKSWKLKLSKKGCFFHLLEKAYWKWDSEKVFDLLTTFSFSLLDLFRVKQMKLDLVLSDSYYLAKMMKAKSCVPIHDLMHRYENDISEMAEGYDYREKMFGRIVKNADLILSDSELGKKQIIESYNCLNGNLNDNVKVLPFVAPSYIYETVENGSSDIQLPDKYLFYPAQFWSHKNHERLLDAIALLRDRGILINLVLAGAKRNDYELIVKKINTLDLNNNVSILGYVSNEEMIHLYKNARALIYPTLFGPTNIPPLEAFALGCPVGVSGIYAMPEQLGEAALYFNPRNIEEIAETIKKLWTDDTLCSELVEKGRKMSEAWGPDQFADRLREILDRQRNKK